MSALPDLPVCDRHPDRETRLACPRCGRPGCVECVGDGVCPRCEAELAAHRPAHAPVEHRPVVAVSIIAVCVAIYGLTSVSADAGGLLIGGGVQQQDLVAQGAWWRVLSAAFLHASLTHLLFNMWALYVLGVELERRVGPLPFAALYLAAAAGGGVTYQVIGGPAPAVGASGAIFGLFGVWLVAAWRSRGTARGRAGLQQILMLLAINAALPLLVPNIAWEAHLGGFLSGVAVAAAWGALPGSMGSPGRPSSAVSLLRAIVAAVVALAALAVVW